MDYYYVHGAHRMAPLDTEAGQLSAMTTMTLMQMVADTYEEARVEWEKNADRELIEGVDDPELFGPINEGQLRVEGWLVHAQFLPPRKRYKSESKKDKSRPSNLQTLAVAEPMVQKENSKFLQARRLFPKKMLNMIKIKNLLSLATLKFWKQLRTRSLSEAVLIPPSNLAVEIPLAPTPKTPKTSDTFSNTHSKVSHSYAQRPRFPTPTRSRTLELEIERSALIDDIQSALPRRSATLPCFLQMDKCHSDVELNPVPATQCMYRTAKAPCETKRRQIITSKQGIFVSKLQHEITIWTLLGITMLGYFCFFILFLACIIIGLKRLMYRSLSLLTFMSDGAANDI